MTVLNRGVEGNALYSYIEEQAHRTLKAYREQPNLVAEHANHEEDTASGGYASRQLFELIQNSADALSSVAGGGNIEICLTRDHLCCADNGAPIDEGGVRALMFSHLSPKRGTAEIGRFGLGFKSVLGVTDAPEFHSRSGSFLFDRDRARDEIQSVAPGLERYPVLRLAFSIDHEQEIEDRELVDLKSWASNIVRLPLKPGSFDTLMMQIRDFPSEFLLFVEHVRCLTLRVPEVQFQRLIMVNRQEQKFDLIDGKEKSRWTIFKSKHRLSNDARADRRTSDDNEEIPIHWAAPLDRLDRPGHFWAFFPTMTASLIPGILNAPWKTNEDRQNLLRGPYNEEIIGAAASLIADSLPGLTSAADPARHLDALPRREEVYDSEHVTVLRQRLYASLESRDIVPDGDGALRSVHSLSYPPRDLIRGRQTATAPLERWAAFPNRPRNWLHHRAMTVNRLAAIGRLFPEGRIPETSLARWLEALVESSSGHDRLEASMAAVRTAAAIPADIRIAGARLGKIVLTETDEWREPEPERLFLPEEHSAGGGVSTFLVHPVLASDPETFWALKTLGLRQASSESRLLWAFGNLVGRKVDGSLLEAFWIAARELSPEVAAEIVERRDDWRRWLRACARSGAWRPLHKLLLPGPVVSSDGGRDEDAALDIGFHETDLKLLRRLGMSDRPRPGCDLSSEEWFYEYRSRCCNDFRSRVGRRPHAHMLIFKSTTASGPLEVMAELSEEGRALYTMQLLDLDGTYLPWTMYHETQRAVYPDMECESPTIQMLKKYGRVRTSDAIVPLADAFGARPKNPEALRVLLKHSMVERIKAVFELAEPEAGLFGDPEVVGEEEPEPLVDLWPGLADHLPATRRGARLVRCEDILSGGLAWNFWDRKPDIYVPRSVPDDELLGLVAENLGLGLSKEQLRLILGHRTPMEVEARRQVIRECSGDAERLLAAVGEDRLRLRLPTSLRTMLREQDGALTGVRIAEAAIATWHTDSLHRFRDALDPLDPPKNWAGSARAVRFVEALGFSPEWAGERNRRREPFVEVDGPSILPALHKYQRHVVDRTRAMFREGRLAVELRRGMISMPTGSGKTRVATQAVVEALREGELKGGVLWVADRDELCEQAVEAWNQVWASEGIRRQRLRISRLWQGQPEPLQTGDHHVVVASIQTLRSRFQSKPDDYAFLADFALVVFDEAHRSIAPTFTGVMQELGMAGRRRRSGEPFLLGLTATPYRGHDEQETRWLSNRYGRNRLDHGAFASDDPRGVVAELQRMEVLARADQEEIEGGILDLNEDEEREMQRAPWLPRSAEERIAMDADRTERILEAFETHIRPDWPALIFATSVEHAQTLAALLTARGVRARAVSGATENGLRRRIVEQFRGGNIRALVNYGVFREGFDAPKTRAIIVARPVYSPNLYFQMIGRGLRGRRNGGNDRCLILNVRDNIANFNRELAFAELDWLWARG